MARFISLFAAHLGCAAAREPRTCVHRPIGCAAAREPRACVHGGG